MTMNRREMLKRSTAAIAGLSVPSLVVAQENIESKLADIEKFVKTNPTRQYIDNGQTFEYKGIDFTVRVDNTGISLQTIADDSTMVYHASQRNYANPDGMSYARGRVSDSEANLMEENTKTDHEILSNQARLMGEVNIERGRTNQTITPYQKQITFKVGRDGTVRGYDFFRGGVGAPEDITAYWAFKSITDHYSPLVDKIHASLVQRKF